MASSLIRREQAARLGLRLYASSFNPVAALEVQAAATASPKKQSAKGPKGPSSAYGLFVQNEHASGRLQGVPFADASKQVAALWKKLPETDRKKFEDASAKEKAQFEELHGKPAKTTRTKAPATGYAKYVSTHYAEAKAKLGNPKQSAEVFKELAKEWKTFSQAEKDKY